MSKVKNRNLLKHFGMAYHESNRCIKVTIPKTCKFPSSSAYVWLKDTHTLAISPNPPQTNMDSSKVNILHMKNRPEYRYFNFGPVTHGLGEPWRIRDVRYKLDGETYLLEIPPEEAREAPIVRGKHKANGAKEPETITLEEAKGSKDSTTERTALVIIELGTRCMEFSVPENELRHLIGDWIVKEYDA